jgi:hypothetical protein
MGEGRRFPTEEQVTWWIQDRVLVDEPGVGDPRVDQLRAANEENENLFLGLVKHVGIENDVCLDVDVSDAKLRGIVKMIIAWERADITTLCPHTNWLVPVVITCDPPSICCQRPDCLRDALYVQHELPFQWDDSCDHCGAAVGVRLTRCMLTIGRMTILAHVCRACKRSLVEG